jgi:two-component system chemotaxis sensor kinase CheA
MAFSLGEYQDIFLEEADEQLQELNQNLLELEKNPDNIEIINNIFRAAHSLKSSAAFVGLNELSDLAHTMENLLQGIRDGSMEITSEVVDIIFKCFDEIRNVIDTVSVGEKPVQDFRWLIEEIQEVFKESENVEQVRKAPAVPQKEKPLNMSAPKTDLDAELRKQIKEGIEDGSRCCEVTIYIERKAQMKWVKAQLLLSNMGKIGEIVSTFPSVENLSDDEMNSIFKVIILTKEPIKNIRKAANVDLVYRLDLRMITLLRKDDRLVLKFGEIQTFTGDQIIGDIGQEKPIEGGEADIAAITGEDGGLEADEADEANEEEEGEDEDRTDIEKSADRAGERTYQDRRKSSILKTVKVSIDKLDLLLNNVGELVIANSGFYKLYEEMRKISEEKAIINEFKSRMEQMSRIAKDLQSGIMKTRMVPIGQVLSRFKRLVRDLSKEFGKEVELIIKGEETELDKKVIDSIGEPLMHLIRNAVDHGIEKPEERKRFGKSEIAHITLNAHQSGNQIFIEVIDDGMGLNLDLIKRKAIEKGFATPEMIAAMGESEIYNLIYTPGFSTAVKITDISGRGVGMNVVKEIVNELNGTVGIETEYGMGTRFILSFPLTLAIIPAIMVKVRHEIYAIPLTDVIETIKIPKSDITVIEGHEVINLRGEILSLLSLPRFVKLESGLEYDDKIPVVVVGFGNKKLGLMVDSLEGKQEIVIKSLEQNFKTVEGLAGASILGDGSICLILDVSSMLTKVIADLDKVSKIDRRKVTQTGEARIEEVESFEEYGGDRAVPDRPQATPEAKVASRNARMAGKKAAGGITGDAKAPETRREAEITGTGRFAGTDAGKPKGGLPTQKSDTAGKMREDESAKEIEKRVHSTLDEFKKELRESIKSTVEEGEPSEHMAMALDVTGNDLDDFRLIANMGATTAAESLSKILNKRIDLSIPEVTIKPIEQIPKFIGDIDSVYMGIMMPILGEIRGTILFIFKESIGYEVIDLLYGTALRKTRELTEEGASALEELTNIVGSSVINVFGEKAGLVIRPGVPAIIHDFLQSVIDSILVLHNMLSDYAIVMDTAFYFEDDKIIGNLLLIPEADSLKTIVQHMRSNVGSN